ncbi:hypothetical protein PQX77_011908 [Marasmius sp. AFHP31]|nr:hypothetical protein PQX77_011908 [Marasmius sp. AFHP31]
MNGSKSNKRKKAEGHADGMHDGELSVKALGIEPRASLSSRPSDVLSVRRRKSNNDSHSLDDHEEVQAVTNLKVAEMNAKTRQGSPG